MLQFPFTPRNFIDLSTMTKIILAAFAVFPVAHAATVATQNFNGVAVPDPASSFFTFDAPDDPNFSQNMASAEFQESVQITAGDDANGTGLGVGYSYIGNNLEDEQITLHVFESLGIGTYEIQFQKRGEFAEDFFSSFISDGTTTNSNFLHPISQANAFESFTTEQITLTSPGDISFTLGYSPSISSFFDTSYSVDDIVLVQVPEPSSAILISLGVAFLNIRRRRSV